ncbi:hypothetical protein E4U21_005871 [Claviceps maximensis]|nr:hypothetical protein E4U21_005871 [Claviceps maximensis]
MPALSSASVFNTTAVHQAISADVSNLTKLADVTAHGVDVVCAWPVSGQYGPGSRILYYVLIAACVLARKAEWIKNACLAAALLLPAVASLHAIALAAFHQDGAVDLDIYGAFQLCAIGILAAPVTVRLSRTYFYDPGRNAIFLWAGLILAGLLSLTVEFYRAGSVPCTHNAQGSLLSPDPNNFPYDAQPACNMTCTADTGPQSPMRGGAANNKYVIPAPDKLTFGTGTLLCAACCVHAVLWLTSMMDKILEINWKSRFGITDEMCNEPIEGTNGATIGKMYLVNEAVRFFMSVAIVPIFASAGLAVLIIGEINFFSAQMRYQNEPMASIGQWGPIVGTGLAIAGSLYLLLAADIEAAMRDTSTTGSEHGCPDEHHPPASPAPDIRGVFQSKCEGGVASLPINGPSSSIHVHETNGHHHHPAGPQPRLSSSGNAVDARKLNHKLSKQSAISLAKQHETPHGEGWSRQRFAAGMMALGRFFGSAAHDSFDLSKFRDGAALDFPEIPGERERNINLAHTRELYNQRLEEDGTPAVQASRSRASSFNGHAPSGHILAAENPRPSLSRDPSPRTRHATSRSVSPCVSSPSRPRPRASTASVTSGSEEPHVAVISSPNDSSEIHRGRQRQRRDTLEVPDVRSLARESLASHRQSHFSVSAGTTCTEDAGSGDKHGRNDDAKGAI